ncbi:MAG: GHKL domain-containing protein [Saprospiraceae bacterium]|nr:GHKL domain-containing protein [Saprospiraceae bacterium]
MNPFKILNFLQAKYDAIFIADHLKPSPLDLRKARVLVSIHLFIIVIGSLFILANAQYSAVDNPSIKLGIFIAIALLVVFKRLGNFVLSGNLMSFILFLLFLEAVFATGGLYSDNLLWMMATPLTALLFANSRSGFAWLVLLLGVTAYLFYLDIQTPGYYRQQTETLDGFYYLITYCGLFLMMVGIVLIFATGQSMIIKALDAKQKELTKQKLELTRQTEALMVAEEKLKSINQELERFAYSASHDLKEPLRMIGSYTNLIRRKIGTDLDPNTKEYMGYITDGVSRMERMLNDLLQYSRLGRNTEHLQDTDLNDTLLVVMQNLMAAMETTNTAIYANQLPVVKSVAVEMIQLFQNLISNAIKFHRKDRTPVIGITYQDGQSHHRFMFMDNGIGIPEKNKQSVFNIFERLHSIQDYEGSGIGLATCKKIVNNMGGEIWVEPDKTDGTTFVFTIPKERRVEAKKQLEGFDTESA